MANDNEQTLTCTICDIKFDNMYSYRKHFASQYHHYNSKRKIAKLQPVSYTIYAQKKDSKY